MAAQPDCCESCMGTGIGNPRIDRSVCSVCNGSGGRRPARQFADEDRWAWNHFDPEPGEDASDAQEINHG
jgi:DnaJ-class molecular chaperone